MHSPVIQRRRRANRSATFIVAAALLCGVVGLLLHTTDPNVSPSAGKTEPPPRVKRIPPRLAMPLAPEHPAEGAPPAPASEVVTDDARWFARRPRASRAPAEPPAAVEPLRPASALSGFVARRPAQPSTVAGDGDGEDVRRPRRTPPPKLRRPARQRRPIHRRPLDATAERLPADTTTGAVGNGPGAPDAAGGPGADDVAVETGDAEFPSTERVAIPVPGEVADDGGSVSLWVEPDWQPGNGDDATLVQLGDTMRVSKHGHSLHLESAGPGGVFHEVGASIDDWNPGERHQVVASWTDGELSLYVDGELVGRRNGHRPVDPGSSSHLYVGSDGSDGKPVAPARIGDVDLRNRPLGDDEVAKGYRDGIRGEQGRGNRPDARDDRRESGERGGSRPSDAAAHGGGPRPQNGRGH